MLYLYIIDKIYINSIDEENVTNQTCTATDYRPSYHGIVGEPEIQKLEKSGRKVAEFYTLSSVSFVFQKCENRCCTNFKSCKRCLFMG